MATATKFLRLCARSLKLECDKLASEKSEMQRHYVMVRAWPGLGGTLDLRCPPGEAQVPSRRPQPQGPPSLAAAGGGGGASGTDADVCLRPLRAP